jgi:hypothetical protein
MGTDLERLFPMHMLQSPASKNSGLGEQLWNTINSPGQPNGGFSEKPRAMPQWRSICSIEHFTCCSFVHSPRSRATEFYKTERNFEISSGLALSL